MLTNLGLYVSNARKAVVQAVGMAGALLSLGLLPMPYSGWLSTAIGVATVILHYWISNADAPGKSPAVALDPEEDEEIPDEWKPAALVTASQVASEHEQAAPPSVESASGEPAT